MSLMTVASALAQLLQSADCSQDDQERLIEETDGFILSRDVTSSIDVPPFSNSAMDGYAVRAVDVAVGQKLSVGQIIAAGARGAPHQAGSASRIFTGAPMPLGADSVLIQEDAEALGDYIVPTESVTAGDHVVYASIQAIGSDFALQVGMHVCRPVFSNILPFMLTQF